MEITERVQTIVAKYVKQWIHTDSSTYLAAHNFGLHIAHYKDAIDCGIQSYIKEKIEMIKNTDLTTFMKPLDDNSQTEQVNKDIRMVQDWIDTL